LSGLYPGRVRALLFALVLVALGLVSVTPVHAQSSGSPRERAVALFAQSVTAYREGRFDEAATLLDEAYALQPEPVLLYNLARAREGAGQDDAAAEAYRRYLATEGTNEADANAARARLAVLDRRIEERRALEARAAEREAQVAAPAPPAPTTHEVAVAPWVVAGSGALVILVGGVLGGLMLDRSAAAQNAPIQTDAAAAQAQAESFAIAADVLYGVGALALGVGVVWGIVDLTSSSSPSSARLRIGPSGLSIAGTF
jgi:tetratricopeptide (TPR) repeat protein